MPEPSSQPAIDLGRLAPGLGSCCDDYLKQYRARLEDAVRHGEGGVAVARKHARSLDGLLSALACACQAAISDKQIGRVALVAVGGYGRGLVGLASDMDVLFLADDPEDGRVRALAEGLLYPLWDLGLQIGHAVRGVDETLKLAREDIRTSTTLLDARRVAGDASIVDELVRGGRRKIFEPALGEFLDSLHEDTERRHERFGGSLYLLEPEVKLGRGGLRDLDVAEWAAKARWGVKGLDEYVRTGALLAREVEELEAAREMLWRVRSFLHLRASRRQDRLTFQDQEDIAESLGFVDGATLGVEQFMQAYYRHARVVAQTAERMLDRARPKPRVRPGAAEDLGDGTMVFDNHVTLRASSELHTDVALALRFYQQVAKRDLPPYPFARDAIARAVAEPAFRGELRDSVEASRLFLEALTCRAEPKVWRGSILGELHEVGLMSAMVPEFEPLTGRVQHDVYHVYTVDVHSVAAVDRLRALARGTLRRELPLACRLAREAPRPTPLYLALLLHDIGKALGGKNHSEKGAKIARPIAERLGLSHVDVEHVVWLVQEHLSLYHWATRRDTSDPESIADIARTVGSLERLKDLYLLTVADVSTTNPNAMTSWKARMLEDLYFAVASVLEGHVPTSSRADEIRAEARVGFVGDAAEAALEAFLRDMPERYILATPVDAIRSHARAARDRSGRSVYVARSPGPTGEISELVVATDDRPGLLADITAVLASHRLSVMNAQIYTRVRAEASPEAFDVFQVRHEGREGEPVDDQLLGLITTDLEGVLSGKLSTEELLARIVAPPRWAVRHVPDVPTEVTVDNAISLHFTVVDVLTRDRIGLLHAIAKALHDEGLSIAISKVGTEGARATDVFYVRERGAKVSDPARLEAIRDRVCEALALYHARFEASEALA